MAFITSFFQLVRDSFCQPMTSAEIKEMLRKNESGFDYLELKAIQFNDLEEYPEALEALFKCFRENTSLENITISGDLSTNADFTTDDFVGLYLSLASSTSLKELTIFHNSGSSEIVALARLIRNVKSLKNLSLSVLSTSTSVEIALNELAGALRSHPSLHELRLTFEIDCDDDVHPASAVDRPIVFDSIARALSQMPVLEKVSLHAGRGAAANATAGALAELLLLSSSLKEIDLYEIGVIESTNDDDWLTLESNQSKLEKVSITFGKSHPSRSLLRATSHVIKCSSSLQVLKIHDYLRPLTENEEYAVILSEGIMDIAKAMDINQSLMSLDLFRRISNESVTSLAKSKRALSGLESLYMSAQSFSDEAAETLMEMISKNPNLKVLHLAGCALSDFSVRSLGATLLGNPSLEDLNLANTFRSSNIDTKVYFFTSLSTNRRLKNLNISGNNLLLECWLSMIGALENGFALEKLTYDYANIPPPVEVLGSILVPATSLKSIEWGRRFNPDEVHKWRMDGDILAQGLRGNSVLESLIINGSTLGDSDCILIANAMFENTTLKTLGIYNAQFTDKGAIAIAEMLRQNSTLENLHLRDNILFDETVISTFADALKSNCVLKTLDLYSKDSNEHISDSQARALVEMLKVNTTLLDLKINPNESRDDVDFYALNYYYLRLNHMGRKKMLQHLSEGAGRHVWFNALIESRKDLDCTFYLLKLNPGSLQDIG